MAIFQRELIYVPGGERFHWLHPSLGKMPDIIGEVKKGERIFLCAAWETRRGEDEEELIGWYAAVQDQNDWLQTFFWRISPERNEAWCRNLLIDLPEDDDLIYYILESSVEATFMLYTS